ncbi:MAG: hypothetical protein ACW98K_00875 [Candidatus Kariarchaeaceae archaeon]
MFNYQHLYRFITSDLMVMGRTLVITTYQSLDLRTFLIVVYLAFLSIKFPVRSDMKYIGNSLLMSIPTLVTVLVISFLNKMEFLRFIIASLINMRR